MITKLASGFAMTKWISAGGDKPHPYNSQKSAELRRGGVYPRPKEDYDHLYRYQAETGNEGNKQLSLTQQIGEFLSRYRI